MLLIGTGKFSRSPEVIMPYVFRLPPRIPNYRAAGPGLGCLICLGSIALHAAAYQPGRTVQAPLEINPPQKLQASSLVSTSGSQADRDGRKGSALSKRVVDYRIEA